MNQIVHQFLRLNSFLLSTLTHRLNLPSSRFSRLNRLQTKLRRQRRLLLLGLGILLIILTPTLIFLLKNPKPIEAGWWNDAWPYRRAISIANNGSQQTDVYINIGLDASDLTRFRPDCSNLRFTDVTGKLLNYFPSCNLDPSIIQVHFDLFPVGEQTIYVYYGHLSAPNGAAAAAFANHASSYTVAQPYGSEEKGTAPLAHWSFDEGFGTTAHNQMQRTSHQGLVSWFKFNEAASGTTPVPTDEMGLITGTSFIGGSSYSPVGKYGRSVTVDGSTGCVSIPTHDAINFTTNQDFTVSFWVMETRSSQGSVVEKWSGSGSYPFVFRYNANDSITFARYDLTNNPGVVGTAPISNGGWNHVVGIKQGSQLKLYINGVQTDAPATDTTVNATHNTSNLFLGCRGGTGQFFTGAIDSLKMYNRALTEDEIQAEYRSLNGHMIGYADSTTTTNIYAQTTDGYIQGNSSDNTTAHTTSSWYTSSTATSWIGRWDEGGWYRQCVP
jgi:hypothetical protein